jgi:hypothetical protein
MNSSVPVCPVPAEQLPINEYQDLRESWFFKWATLSHVDYLKPLVLLWGMSWFVVGPVAAVSFPPAKHFLQFSLSATAGACLIPFLTMLRLYLGWKYVQSRLLNKTIFYEESGWYDGQTWIKPEEVLQRDRLIVTYQIRPILARLKLTLVIIASTLIGTGIICKLVN